MNWTTEWPTKAGWYWMKDSEVDAPEIVYYYTSRGVVDSFGQCVIGDTGVGSFEFYGPIEPPASKSPQNA